MKGHPGWKSVDLSEWLNQDPRGNEWADPHIRLVTINTTIGKENEVLVGELGSLAQAIFIVYINQSFGTRKSSRYISG